MSRIVSQLVDLLRPLTAWISDHLLWFMVVGGVVLVVAAVSSLRRAIRSARDPAARRRWLEVAVSAAVFALSGTGLFLLAGLAVTIGPALMAQRALEGEAAPPLAFVRVADGAGASLVDYRGRVVLVNFWATWCPPCRAELDALNQLQERYQDAGLTVVQVSQESREHLAAFLRAKPLLAVQGRLDETEWPVAGIPTSFVIDRAGTVRGSIVGARSLAAFERLITPHL